MTTNDKLTAEQIEGLAVRLQGLSTEHPEDYNPKTVPALLCEIAQALRQYAKDRRVLDALMAEHEMGRSTERFDPEGAVYDKWVEASNAAQQAIDFTRLSIFLTKENNMTTNEKYVESQTALNNALADKALAEAEAIREETKRRNDEK